MTNQERFDIHQHITDQIVAAIERGAGEFRLPWHRSGGNVMRPVNVVSKKAYRGVNILALWATAEEKGYASGTYRQWWGHQTICSKSYGNRVSCPPHFSGTTLRRAQEREIRQFAIRGLARRMTNRFYNSLISRRLWLSVRF
jgi:hypothetical protein